MNLVVTNLNGCTSESSLQIAFEMYGKIKSVEIIVQKDLENSAIVRFYRRIEAENGKKHMNGYQVFFKVYFFEKNWRIKPTFFIAGRECIESWLGR